MKNKTRFALPLALPVLLLFLIPGLSQAKNIAVIVGGGCDEKHAFSYFLPGMEKNARALSQGAWKTKILFDGSIKDCHWPRTDPHCTGPKPEAGCCPDGIDPSGWDTSALKNAGISGDLKDATKTDLIEELSAAAKELSSGDQLLLNIQTHGDVDKQTKVHGVCISDGQSPTMSIEDPKFLAALSRFKAKGVRMGFIDQSCYSGGSVRVLDQFGCVLSLTDADHEGEIGSASGDVISKAFEKLSQKAPAERGKMALDQLDSRRSPKSAKLSLEDLYLQVLANTVQEDKMNVPQSSGALEPEGELLEKFLNTTDLSGGFHGGPSEGLKNLSNAFCSIPKEQFDGLERFLSDLSGISETSLTSGERQFLDQYWQGFGNYIKTGLGRDFSTHFNRFSALLKPTAEYDEINSIWLKLSGADIGVDLSAVPAEVRARLAQVLPVSGMSGTIDNPAQRLRFNGFSVPSSDYALLIDPAIERLRKGHTEAAFPANYSWDKLRNDLLAAFHSTDRAIPPTERTHLLEKQSRFQELSRTIRDRENELSFTQGNATREYLLLKAAHLVKNRKQRSKPRDACAEFKLF